MDSAHFVSEPTGFMFEDFELYSAERRLMRSGVRVRLGSRSLDILIALVRSAGQIVRKDDLIMSVWPDTIVEESALRVHISTLRKAIGDDGHRLIANVPGRGYSFVAPVRLLGGDGMPAAALTSHNPPRPAFKLPRPLARVIGRDDIVAEVAASVAAGNLVSIVGPGGIGKSTVALAVARSLAGGITGEVVFVDLAQLHDPDLTPAAVAIALGLAVRSSDVVSDIVTAIAGRRLILLLDSCEHVIDAATGLAEALLGSAPDLKILATSREALRAQGERVHRLLPLDLPTEALDLTASEALSFSAIELFVDRAAGVLGSYELTDAEAPVVAHVCQRLDGIALAIELATGRLDSISVASLAKSLENSFAILTRGRRTALPRHQTLRGTIDWSYGILSDDERTVLQRLSVFVGPFAIEAAQAVASDGLPTPADVDDIVHSLVAKSLVSADARGGEARYRLLDTMRRYAGEKLDESGHVERTRRSHTLFFRNLLANADADGSVTAANATLADIEGQLGNIRAAIDWAFSSEGEGSIGVALTVNAIPFWFQLSLVDECIGRVQSALAWLEASPEPDARARMQLYAGLGFPQMRGTARFPGGADAWRSALAIAEAIGDDDFQARSLWALWTDRINSGEAEEAMGFADRFAALAGRNAAAANPLIARRLRAAAKLKLGKLDEALHDVSEMLAGYAPATRRADVTRFQYDQRSVARITLARALWLKGLADRANSEVESNLRETAASDHILTHSHVLSDAACFIALWRGDLETAGRHVTDLRAHTKLKALDVWQMYAECFEGEIRIRNGDEAGGIAQLTAALAALRGAGFVRYDCAFASVLGNHLRRTGEADKALAIVDPVLARCARTGEAWCVPELLRIRSEALIEIGQSEAAEQGFRTAFALAQKQGALAWQLRVATSRAKSACGGPDAGVALDQLRSVLGRVEEGFDTADVVAATALVAAAS